MSIESIIVLVYFYKNLASFTQEMKCQYRKLPVYNWSIFFSNLFENSRKMYCCEPWGPQYYRRSYLDPPKRGKACIRGCPPRQVIIKRIETWGKHRFTFRQDPFGGAKSFLEPYDDFTYISDMIYEYPQHALKKDQFRWLEWINMIHLFLLINYSIQEETNISNNYFHNRWASSPA